MSVNLTPASTGVELYNNPINLIPSGTITLNPNRTNATVSFNCYVGYAAYDIGRGYEFTVKMNTHPLVFDQTKTVITYPTTNKGWVSCIFTIANTNSGININSFTLTQTYRYNSNYNANIRPASEGQHYANYSQGSKSRTNVHAPGNVYWGNTSESQSILVPPSASRSLQWYAGYPGANTIISGYEIYRSTNNSDTYTYLDSTTDTQYTVTGPTTGSYYYKIKSKSSPPGYDSGLSSSYAYMTVSVGSLSVPTNPRLDTEYLTSGSTTFRWDAVNNATRNNVTGYTVYKTVNGNKTALGTTITTSYTVTAEPSGSAVYTVRANGQYSNSAESSSVTLYTYTLITAPTNVSLSANSAAPGVTLTLSWSGAQDGVYNAISGYEIYRSESSSTGFTKYGNTLSSIASSASVISNSTQGGTYYYKVRVLGTRSDYSESSSVSVTTYLYSAVGAPSTVSVSPISVPSFGGSATLSWGQGIDSAHVTVSYYQIWRCTTQNGTYEKLGNTTNRDMTVYGPTTGSYYYKVQSIASVVGYDSELSSAIAVLSVSNAPTIPENFSVRPYNYVSGNLFFIWDASVAPGLRPVTYDIYMTYNQSTTAIATEIDDTSYYLDLTSIIEIGTSATFYVVAVSDQNESSDPSNIVTVTRVASITSEDVEVYGDLGSGTYSYHPTILVRANKRIKALSTYEFAPIPYNTFVNQSNYIVLKYQYSNIYDDFNDMSQYTTLQEKTYTGRVALEDEYGNSIIKSITFKVMRDPFIGEQVGANLPIKAIHINLLITLLQNESRFLLDERNFRNHSLVIAGVTPLNLWEDHITELRTLINYLINSINYLVANSIIPVDWETVSANKPKASVMHQIHEAIVNKL